MTVCYFLAVPAWYVKFGVISWPYLAGGAWLCAIVIGVYYVAASPLHCAVCGAPVMLDGGQKKHPYAKRLLFMSQRARVAFDVLFHRNYHCMYCHTRCRCKSQGSTGDNARGTKAKRQAVAQGAPATPPVVVPFSSVFGQDASVDSVFGGGEVTAPVSTSAEAAGQRKVGPDFTSAPTKESPWSQSPIITMPIALTGPTAPPKVGTEPVMPFSAITEPVMPFSAITEPVMPFSAITEPVMPHRAATEPVMPFSAITEPVMPHRAATGVVPAVTNEPNMAKPAAGLSPSTAPLNNPFLAAAAGVKPSHGLKLPPMEPITGIVPLGPSRNGQPTGLSPFLPTNTTAGIEPPASPHPDPTNMNTENRAITTPPFVQDFPLLSSVGPESQQQSPPWTLPSSPAPHRIAQPQAMPQSPFLSPPSDSTPISPLRPPQQMARRSVAPVELLQSPDPAPSPERISLPNLAKEGPRGPLPAAFTAPVPLPYLPVAAPGAEARVAIQPIISPATVLPTNRSASTGAGVEYAQSPVAAHTGFKIPEEAVPPPAATFAPHVVSSAPVNATPTPPPVPAEHYTPVAPALSAPAAAAPSAPVAAAPPAGSAAPLVNEIVNVLASSQQQITNAFSGLIEKLQAVMVHTAQPLPPAPVYQAPEPLPLPPAPVYHAPEPQPLPPAPVYHAPAPLPLPPAPVYHAPAPAPLPLPAAPVYQVPEPQPLPPAPAPVYHAPAPLPVEYEPEPLPVRHQFLEPVMAPAIALPPPVQDTAPRRRFARPAVAAAHLNQVIDEAFAQQTPPAGEVDYSPVRPAPPQYAQAYSVPAPAPAMPAAAVRPHPASFADPGMAAPAQPRRASGSAALPPSPMPFPQAQNHSNPFAIAGDLDGHPAPWLPPGS